MGIEQSSITAGRKRSRNEASMNLEPDSQATSLTLESEEDWAYGEGMVLIKPGSGYITDATSQSGTWVEEQEGITKETTTRHLVEQTDHVRSRKAHRIDQSEHIISPSKEVGEMVHGAGITTGTPIIDDFTIHLGIGWSKLCETGHIQAAARGWARYIENHYPLSHVVVRLESKGLQSYLVEAREGLFLFAEDLSHGRLVSRTADGALRNLQNGPPVFEGRDELWAAESCSLPPNRTGTLTTPSGAMDLD